MSTAARRDGGIWVRTDPVGRPLELRIDPGQLERGHAALAEDIRRLCRIAGARAGVERRDELSASGVGADVLRGMGLPTRRDLADLESEMDDEDTEVDTWMRPV